MLGILGLLFSLVGFAAAIVILIHAFKAGVQQGVMCLCIPFYILYYAFTKFEHEKKNLIIGVWLGAVIIGSILQSMNARQMQADAMEAAGVPAEAAE